MGFIPDEILLSPLHSNFSTTERAHALLAETAFTSLRLSATFAAAAVKKASTLSLDETVGAGFEWRYVGKRTPGS